MGNIKCFLIIVVVFNFFSSLSFGQGKVILYAYKFNSFTKIPLTEKSIKEGYTYRKKIKKKPFFEKIDLLLRDKTPLQENPIVSDQIRIYISSNRKELVISKDLYLKYNNQYYYLDKEILQVILEYIPIDERKFYTPMSFREPEH